MRRSTTRKPSERRSTVECRDCHVTCSPDNLCPCCVAIERDAERDAD